MKQPEESCGAPEAVLRMGRYAICRYASLPSTNTFLKANFAALPDFAVICALTQTAGRGRLDRLWQSAPGRDLCFSVLLPLARVPSKARGNIPQLAALAVCRVLAARGMCPQMKWPNDVLVAGAKIAGVLGETAGCNERISMVTGVGVNVNSRADELARIGQPAVSCRQLLGTTTDIAVLLEDILKVLADYWDEFVRAGFAGLHARAEALLYGLNTRVRIVAGPAAHTGRIAGLAMDGGLLFDCERSGRITLYTGATEAV